MSRGPGRIEKAVEALLATGEYSVSDLEIAVYGHPRAFSDVTIRKAIKRIGKRRAVNHRQVYQLGRPGRNYVYSL